jgi:hypothetical protein
MVKWKAVFESDENTSNFSLLFSILGSHSSGSISKLVRLCRLLEIEDDSEKPISSIFKV